MTNNQPKPAPNKGIGRGELRRLQATTRRLINDYERMRLLASDAKEKERYTRELVELRKQLEAYERQYEALGESEKASSKRKAVKAESFPDELVNQLPHPIAVACAGFNQASDATASLLALDAVLLGTVKYLVAVTLAQIRRDDPRSSHLRPWLDRLSDGGLDEWSAHLKEIGDHYADKGADPPAVIAAIFVPYRRSLTKDAAMTGAYREIGGRIKAQADHREPTAEHFLERLVTYRKDNWHTKVPNLPAGFAQELLPILGPALRELLQTIWLVKNYPLRFTENVRRSADEWVYDMEDWRGPAEPTSCGEDCRVKVSGDKPPYKEDRLYLCTPDGLPLLNLSPFLVRHKKHLFFLEALKEQGRLALRPCHGGDLLTVEQKLFSMPGLRSGEGEVGARLDEAEQKVDELEAPVSPKEDQPKDPADKPTDAGGLPQLLARLDDDARAALETALGESLRIGHFWLGVEFLLMALSRQEEGVFAQALGNVGIEPGNLRGLLRGLAGVKDQGFRNQRDVQALGAGAFADLREIDPATLAADYTAGKPPKAGVTPRMMAALREALRLAGAGKVGPNHLLLAALSQPRCTAVMFLLMQVAQADHDPQEWLAQLQQRAGIAGPVSPGGQGPQPGQGQQPQGAPIRGKGLLGQLGRDLTSLAQADPPQIRPAIGAGAHKAMVQMGLILQQTQANNPILLGDPGVGKTAIVEGFAWRLATDPKVVPQLAGRRIVDLPAAALLAGTKYRGDLEERLQKVLAEVQAARGQTVVFIDEIHTILGGKAEGGLGAISDALKPALARGEFPCIGATTVAEYRRYIESDPALARRFTPVWIEEPSVKEAIEIAKKVAGEHLAKQHGVAYPDDVVLEAVQLAVRYLHEEFLPGKAIKLLDQAGPRAIMGGSLSGRKGDAAAIGSGEVTVDLVRQIVAERTGVPLARLSEGERDRVRRLEERLRARVQGQDDAVAAVAAVVKRARAGLADPRRPVGVFLFAGPTGVGKTELALALAEALFDDQDAILRLDMSEYMEKHQVARLIGSPPGYIGHEEEGQLTGRLRRRPYSVVLLDEMEKAHPDVQHLFLQLFDAGRLTDSRGHVADGRNAIFIMTTNLGAREAMGLINDRRPYEEKLQEAITQHFSPEFLNRINRIVYFRPLTPELLAAIFDKLFARAAARFRDQGIEVTVDPAFKADFCRAHADPKQGARPLERAIEDEIVALLVEKLLDGEIEPGARVVVQSGDQLNIEANPAPQEEKPAAGQPAAKEGPT